MSFGQPLTTKDSGMVLDRVTKPGLDQKEQVRFMDITWAQPYKAGGYYGTLVLHATGGFRFYTQPFGSISTQVCQYVGRLVKQGSATLENAPKFPWVTDQAK